MLLIPPVLDYRTALSNLFSFFSSFLFRFVLFCYLSLSLSLHVHFHSLSPSPRPQLDLLILVVRSFGFHSLTNTYVVSRFGVTVLKGYSKEAFTPSHPTSPNHTHTLTKLCLFRYVFQGLQTSESVVCDFILVLTDFFFPSPSLCLFLSLAFRLPTHSFRS